MKKSLISIASVLLLLSSASAQEDANVVAPAQEQAKVNTGKGFYVGAGVGYSYYWAALSESTYNMDNGQYKFSEQDLSDSDTGYILYAGYQFNKIVGVELAYTDYGQYTHVDITGKEVQQDPVSTSLYANLGYNFLNGQLRPFGLLGIGYLQQNQSEKYLDVDENVATAHFGVGVEYYPTVLKGLGIRATWTSDYYYESTYGYTASDVQADVVLWQQYGLLSASIQYKF